MTTTPKDTEPLLAKIMPQITIMIIWLCTVGIIAILVTQLPAFTFASDNLLGFSAIGVTLGVAAMSTYSLARYGE